MMSINQFLSGEGITNAVAIEVVRLALALTQNGHVYTWVRRQCRDGAALVSITLRCRISQILRLSRLVVAIMLVAALVVDAAGSVLPGA